ncbi:MAG: HipA domain-containing protein [Bacilli bacterium]|nr:HipA domain-containing protein [Bacilli bacterium]
MKKYPIINMDPKGDLPENLGTKKKSFENVNGKRALVKMNVYKEMPDGSFNVEDERNSHNVSEKFFSEIALFLGFNCVHIDFVIDSNSFNWLSSYDFNKAGVNTFSGKALYTIHKPEIIKRDSKHGIDNDYHYEDILNILYHYSSNSYKLIRNFNKMMIMDALTGESDRHYENWGIAKENNEYLLLPMYDNSACLLHSARNEQSLQNIKRKDFENYCRKSISKIMINNKKTTHFDFLRLLLSSFESQERQYLISDITHLTKLTNEVIHDIVNKVPDIFCTKEHKKNIIKYIIIRRDYILNIVEEI